MDRILSDIAAHLGEGVRVVRLRGYVGLRRVGQPLLVLTAAGAHALGAELQKKAAELEAERHCGQGGS